MKIYQRYIKRPQDVILSAIALFMVSPILVIVAILVKLKLGSPILFKQQRPGKDGKLFEIYKFRTMTNEKNEQGELLPNEERLTPFGQILRSLSLDELPSLINIIKGDLSIVGPRPLLIRYLPYYTEEQFRRHEVSPGLTGLAQVNGRNRLTWPDRFALDVKYVDEITFMNDWKIIFKTILIVITREGITPDHALMMEDFVGDSTPKTRDTHLKEQQYILFSKTKQSSKIE